MSQTGQKIFVGHIYDKECVPRIQTKKRKQNKNQKLLKIW